MGELLVAGRLWQQPYLEQLQTDGLDVLSTEPAEAASRIVAPER